MTRVSQADQVLLLLRERLQRMDRARAERGGRAGGPRGATPRPLARLQAMPSLGELGDEEFRRTLVRAVLAEQLGDGIANDPSFQALTDEIFRIIAESDEGRTLIDRAAAQLRGEG